MKVGLLKKIIRNKIQPVTRQKKKFLSTNWN